MFVFYSELTLVLYFLISMFVFASIQLFLCMKIKYKFILYTPTFVLLCLWCFVLLMALGVFGTSGGGFIGNEHLLGASILSILFLPATIGVAIGWILNKIYKKVEFKK